MGTISLSLIRDSNHLVSRELGHGSASFHTPTSSSEFSNRLITAPLCPYESLYPDECIDKDGESIRGDLLTRLKGSVPNLHLLRTSRGLADPSEEGQEGLKG
jgi:hypothetical protein